MCAALGDGVMAGLGVVGTIATDASDGFVGANLSKQARQHRCIAGGVVRDLDGTDFQGTSINAKVCNLRH